MRNAPSAIGKSQRQHLVAGIIAKHAVTSQIHLGNLLVQQGVSATQATISRDLEDLGAVKVRVPSGEGRYAILDLSHRQPAPAKHLARAVADYVVGAESAANLVVLRTPPGSANTVATAIDRAAIADIVGSVAGDDTILVVVADAPKAAGQAQRFREMLSPRRPARR